VDFTLLFLYNLQFLLEPLEGTVAMQSMLMLCLEEDVFN